MEKYGTEIRLLGNQVYTINLKIKGEEANISFTSRYSPLYSTAVIIRGDFKKLFSVYTDDEINRLIHDNSTMALTLANPVINTSADIPYYVKQYVRYKTELDLVTDILVTLSMDAGQQQKDLGVLKILREVRTPDVEKLIKLLEGRLAPWETQLVSMRGARPKGAIRAGGTAFPLNGRVF